jgi:phospholipid transport system transporter-binding protein
MKTANISFQDGVIHISGALDRHTARQAYEKANVYFNGVDALTIDLKEVSFTDSAGLAVLLAWIRRSKAQAVRLTFVNLPEKMKDLSRVSGLDHLLLLSK